MVKKRELPEEAAAGLSVLFTVLYICRLIQTKEDHKKGQKKKEAGEADKDKK